MPQERLSMRKITEVLRLKHERNISNQHIFKMLFNFASYNIILFISSKSPYLQADYVFSLRQN
jgi:hypothetical protein